jgi:hypothetical protein
MNKILAELDILFAITVCFLDLNQENAGYLKNG